MNQRYCLINPDHKTYIDKRYQTERWLRYKDGWICDKCYKRLISNPKRSKEYIKKYNDRRTKEYIKKYSDLKTPEQVKYWNSFRFLFRDKILRADKPIKRDRCLWCGRQKGDKYINCFGEIAVINRIHIHHVEYDDQDPLNHTILLCSSCHMKETRKQDIKI